jgi:hypothetical protein
MIFWISDGNALTGPIPSEIGSLTTLTYLYFRKSLLSFNCVHLCYEYVLICLWYFGFQGTTPWLVRSLPSWDCSPSWIISPYVRPLVVHSTIAETRFLHLTASFLIVFSDSNALTGSIPSELGQLTNAVIYFGFEIVNTHNYFTNCAAFKAQHPSYVEC